MDPLVIELNKEYRQERLREAEKERMLNQFRRGAGFDLPHKVLTCLREFLTRRAKMNLQHPNQTIKTKPASRSTLYVLEKYASSEKH